MGGGIGREGSEGVREKWREGNGGRGWRGKEGREAVRDKGRDGGRRKEVGREGVRGR